MSPEGAVRPRASADTSGNARMPMLSILSQSTKLNVTLSHLRKIKGKIVLHIRCRTLNPWGVRTSDVRTPKCAYNCNQNHQMSLYK